MTRATDQSHSKWASESLCQPGPTQSNTQSTYERIRTRTRYLFGIISKMEIHQGAVRGRSKVIQTAIVCVLWTLVVALMIAPASAGFFDSWFKKKQPPYSGGYAEPAAFGRRR